MVVPTRRPLHVLITSTPGSGHVGPLAPIAAALRSAGHQVLWAIAEEAGDRVRAMGFDAVAAGMGVGDRRAALAPQLAEIMALDPRQRRQRFFAGFFAEAAAPRMHEDLTPVFQSFQPDVVIHEMAELAAAPMAVGRDIPHVTVAFSGALDDSTLSRARRSMDGIWRAEGVTGTDLSQMFGGLYLHPFPPSFGAPPPYAPTRLVQPGPAPSTVAEVPDWLLHLGTQRPLVYLTSGTEAIAQDAPWAAMFEAIGAMDVDAVATTGVIAAETFGALPANIHAEQFVPQAWVLTRASVVASHGGAGTVLGAAAHGVPQVLYPLAADQWENADAVARCGAGVVCEIDRRDASTLSAALARALSEPELRAAAQAVAAEIAAMPTAADHVAAIEALVA